jgi:hypothetical protein
MPICGALLLVFFSKDGGKAGEVPAALDDGRSDVVLDKSSAFQGR